MISLSRVLKRAHYADSSRIRAIKIAEAFAYQSAKGKNLNNPVNHTSEQDLTETMQIKEQILRDAEQHANQLIEKAQADAVKILEDAKKEAATWWEQERAKDEQIKEEAKQAGYDEGYSSGEQAAEQAILGRYESLIQEARSILERAQQEKQRRMMESEVFLVELSCEIAEKIVGRQLHLEPEWHKEMILQLLAKKREQGLITLCVSPKSYGYLQDAREELRSVLGPEADLHIIPDLSVRDPGCIIRSEYGSIDARIDTQLQEIKQKLRQAALECEAYSIEGTENVSG